MAVGPLGRTVLPGNVTCSYKPAAGRQTHLVALTTYAASGTAALATATSTFPDATAVPNLGDAALFSPKPHVLGVSDGNPLFGVILIRADSLTASPATNDGAANEVWWRALYNAGVDVVLNGHDHVYTRWAPQTSNGQVDRKYGIRQFTTGTGGEALDPWPVRCRLLSKRPMTSPTASASSALTRMDTHGDSPRPSAPIKTPAPRPATLLPPAERTLSAARRATRSPSRGVGPRRGRPARGVRQTEAYDRCRTLAGSRCACVTYPGSVAAARVPGAVGADSSSGGGVAAVEGARRGLLAEFGGSAASE